MKIFVGQQYGDRIVTEIKTGLNLIGKEATLVFYKLNQENNKIYFCSLPIFLRSKCPYYKKYLKNNHNPRKHKNWTSDKRKYLGIPDNKFPVLSNFGGRDWIRELVRMRDKHTCQKCGKKWQEGKRRFDVHHMDSCKEGKSHTKGIVKMDKKNFNRMITLCHKCHLNLDTVRGKMSLGLKKWYKLTKR